MARGRQGELNAHFAAEQADMQTRLVLLEDAFNTIERTLTDLMSALQAGGRLEPDLDFVARWLEAVRLLRESGLRERPLPGELPTAGISCPSCSSVLRNIAGAPGDRCDWCGYVFPVVCPSCNRVLENVRGEPGDVCLWCQHQFA